jgi:hypothetical protein
MLKRLGAYPRQNGLALALREIGRIERTLYTLNWLEKLARTGAAQTASNGGTEHRRKPQRAGTGRVLPSPRSFARPHGRTAATPRS